MDENKPPNLQDFRKLLYETALGIKDKTIDVDEAKQIAALARVAVESAQVEVNGIKATNGALQASGFLGNTVPTNDKKQLENGVKK